MTAARGVGAAWPRPVRHKRRGADASSHGFQEIFVEYRRRRTSHRVSAGSPAPPAVRSDEDAASSLPVFDAELRTLTKILPFPINSAIERAAGVSRHSMERQRGRAICRPRFPTREVARPSSGSSPSRIRLDKAVRSRPRGAIPATRRLGRSLQCGELSLASATSDANPRDQSRNSPEHPSNLRYRELRGHARRGSRRFARTASHAVDTGIQVVSSLAMAPPISSCCSLPWRGGASRGDGPPCRRHPSGSVGSILSGCQQDQASKQAPCQGQLAVHE